jgi:serine protease Do
VNLTVQRPEGTKQVSVTLGTLPGDQEDTPRGPGEPGGGERSGLEGVSVEGLTPETARQLQLPEGITGVVISDVRPDSPAAEAGLRRGDVIQQVNRRNVASVREFENAVRAARGSMVLLVSSRAGSRFVVVEPSTR